MAFPTLPAILAARELRAPMTTVRLLVDLIQAGGTPSDLEQYYATLRSVLERQRFFLDKVLTVGRLEDDQIHFRAVPVALQSILESIYATYLPVCDVSAIGMTLTAAPRLPAVLGDREFLHLICMDLVDNAVKFSHQGGDVTVRAAVGQNGPHRSVVVSVTDHGIGVPRDEVPRVFELRFRGRDAIKHAIPGIGVGLYVAKKLAEGMGATIAARSTLGHGTTVELVLPLASAR